MESYYILGRDGLSVHHHNLKFRLYLLTFHYVLKGEVINLLKHNFHDVRGIACCRIELNKNVDSVWTQTAPFRHPCDTGQDTSLLCVSPLPMKRSDTAADLQAVVRIEWEGTCVHQTQNKHLVMLINGYDKQ